MGGGVAVWNSDPARLLLQLTGLPRAADTYQVFADQSLYAVMPNRRPLLSKPWSPEDDAKLLALLERGNTNTTFIAARLRRTPAAVHRRKATLNLRREQERGTKDNV